MWVGCTGVCRGLGGFPSNREDAIGTKALPHLAAGVGSSENWRVTKAAITCVSCLAVIAGDEMLSHSLRGAGRGTWELSVRMCYLLGCLGRELSASLLSSTLTMLVATGFNYSPVLLFFPSHHGHFFLLWWYTWWPMTLCLAWRDCQH